MNKICMTKSKEKNLTRKKKRMHNNKYLPTFLRKTFISKPLSGSFLPFNAGSSGGSAPLIQSALVSRTETKILEKKKYKNTNIHVLEYQCNDKWTIITHTKKSIMILKYKCCNISVMINGPSSHTRKKA